MYASNYYENLMLNLMKGQSVGATSTFYLALFLSNPGDTGTEGTEITYTAYARQPIAFSSPAASGSGLMIQNTALISFGESATSAGTVTHVAVFDSLTGGNMYLYGALDVPLVVQAGVSPVFRAGSVKWIWTGNLSNYYRTAIMNIMNGGTVTGFSPYVALYNGDPATSGVEFTGANYARFAVTMSNPSQQSSGTAMSQNTADVLSNISTGNWGTLTHVAICDASTGGNPYAIISLGRSYSVPLGTAVGFHAGDLQMNVN